MEGVVPGEHGAAEAGLPQRVGRALAVRDVEHRRRRRATAPREVGGTAGAVVERGARAADDLREALADAPQARDLAVDLVDLRGEPDAERLVGRPLDAQELLDLGEREAEPLRLLDRADEAHRLVVVGAVPGGRAVGLGQEAAPLVVAERLDVDPGPGGCLTDAHPFDCKPGLWYGLQVHDRPRLHPRLRPAALRALLRRRPGAARHRADGVGRGGRRVVGLLARRRRAGEGAHAAAARRLPRPVAPGRRAVLARGHRGRLPERRAAGAAAALRRRLLRRVPARPGRQQRRGRPQRPRPARGRSTTSGSG